MRPGDRMLAPTMIRLPARYRGLSLRWKILVPFLLLSALISSGGAGVLGMSLERGVYDQANADVQQLATLSAGYLEREANHIAKEAQLLMEEGRLLLGDQALGHVTASLDSGAFMQLLTPGGVMDVDLIKLVDRRGHTLMERRRTLFEGGQLDDERLISKALSGTVIGSVVNVSGQPRSYLAGATPIRSRAGIRGALLLGTSVDRGLLDRIAVPEGHALLALGPTGMVASTLSDGSSDGWSAVPASGAPNRLTLAGREYLVVSVPLRLPGAHDSLRVAALQAVGPLAKEATASWNRTWLIFGAGGVVFILVGIIVTSRLARPVRELTEVSGRLAAGDFDARATVHSQDEIGALAAAFNAMGEELKSREEKLSEAFQELKRLSETDTLTGLLNHRMVHEFLNKEVARAQRHGGRFSVIILDLDDFKLLNDTYGHPAGDEMLRQVGGILAGKTRASDIIGRHGGDEFMLILPETGAADAARLAQKLRAALAEKPFVAPDGVRLPTHVSFGIAAYPNDGVEVNELVAFADANLYTSKRRGGDTITGGEEAKAAQSGEAGAFGMLESMVTAVDNKDRYTRRHSEEVTEYALAIAGSLGLSEETQRVLRVAGLLHDVGKIGVPDRILRKPGRLTSDEYDIIKQHTVLGEVIIAAIPHLDEIRTAVVSHHERYDGGGYPSGLSSEGIPLLGRILAVADAYSAMTTDRPYRKAMTQDEAIAELRAQAGKQFDPALVPAFIRALAVPGNGQGRPSTKKSRA